MGKKTRHKQSWSQRGQPSQEAVTARRATFGRWDVRCWRWRLVWYPGQTAAGALTRQCGRRVLCLATQPATAPPARTVRRELPDGILLPAPLREFAARCFNAERARATAHHMLGDPFV